MVRNNPNRPFDSPIKVSHSGEWNDEFKHEIANSRPYTGEPIPQTVSNFARIHQWQESKTDDAVIDRNIEREVSRAKAKTRRNSAEQSREEFTEDAVMQQVIKRDLQKRNIPTNDK